MPATRWPPPDPESITLRQQATHTTPGSVFNSPARRPERVASGPLVVQKPVTISSRARTADQLPPGEKEVAQEHKQ